MRNDVSDHSLHSVDYRATTKTLLYDCSLKLYLSLQISGLGLLIAGIVVLNDVDDFSHFLEGRITAPPIILIVTGLLIFLIAFLGCYGALKESPKLLMIVSIQETKALYNYFVQKIIFQFAFLLAIIFIVEIAVGIAAITFKNDLRDILNSNLQTSMTRQSKVSCESRDAHVFYAVNNH